jgi:hypothetical protein
MTRLNPRQPEAVNYVGGPLLLLADAGAGITSVITRKIAHLVQNCGIQARQNQWGQESMGSPFRRRCQASQSIPFRRLSSGAAASRSRH